MCHRTTSLSGIHALVLINLCLRLLLAKQQAKLLLFCVKLLHIDLYKLTEFMVGRISLAATSAMNVYLIAILTFIASVLADHHEGKYEVTKEELAGGLSNLFRRFTRFSAPEQLTLADELDIQWRHGMMRNQPMKSAVKASFDSDDKYAFSSIHTIISPEQKGLSGDSTWSKHDKSEVLVTYHYGAPLLFHFLTESGVHKEIVLGNPLQLKGAKFSVMVPRSTYATIESLSTKKFTFISVTSIPAWSKDGHMVLKKEDMITKFPDFEGMIRNSTDFTKRPMYNVHDDDDDDDQDNHHHHHSDHDDMHHNTQKRSY